MYTELIQLVSKARSRSAVFCKTDLHVHSGESKDFPRLGDKPGCCTTLCEQDKNPTAKDFIQFAEKAGLRLMAITDHNKSKIAEQIAHASSSKVTVLPGMEANLQTSIFPESTIHVLAIFPHNYGYADIDKVFPKPNKMPLYSDRTDASCAKMSASDFVEAVHDNGGICIASHVNSTKGVRSMFRSSSVKLLKARIRQQALQEARKARTLSADEETQLTEVTNTLKGLEDETQKAYLEFVIENRFDAVEIEDPEESEYYAGIHVAELGLPTIPCVVGSDAHNLSDIGLPGFTTYIKMTKPGLADLQKALEDPGTRIRFEHNIGSPRTAHILGVVFDGGFFVNNAIGFSDDLTCLIGGRGSGKSATIEAIRYVFDKPVDRLSRKKDIEDRREHTLTDTEVKIVYQDENSDVYVLKRRFGELETQCFDEKGNPYSDIGPAISDLLKVKIFGWGEIEELAKNKADQLTLIDGFVPQATPAKDSVQKWLRELSNNTTQIVQTADDVSLQMPKVQELPGKKEMLLKLSSPELDAIFREFDQNQEATGAVANLEHVLEGIRGSFVKDDGSPIDIEKRLVQVLEAMESQLTSYEWFGDIKSQFRKRVQVAADRYKALLTEMESMAKIIVGMVGRLKEDRTRIDADLNRYAEGVKGADGKSLMSRRKTLKQEVDQLQRIQDEIDRQQKAIEDRLSDRWSRIVPALEAARDELTGLRSAKLGDINKQLQELSTTTPVSVGIIHQGDRRCFEVALGSHEPKAPQGLLRGIVNQYKENRYARRYALQHTPHTFVQAILKRDLVSLQLPQWNERDETRDRMTEQQAESVLERLSVLQEDGIHYEPEKLARLLELEHAATDDLPSICLGTTPIEELSPGQRCSALIPIILLEGNCPLVIDQPEDNLDNRLVFGLLVDILRSLKERRQIIVATHNPNIPVSGDAEQIVVFSAKNKANCEPVEQGSIDCPDIIQQVMAIMEGSEEAFRIRYEKYQHHLH